MLVDNQINVVSQEELENDSRVVFNENDEQVSKDLSDIKHWISSTPHMVNTRTDDLFLKLFLRGCNYNVKDTKEKLDMYFTVRLVCTFGIEIDTSGAYVQGQALG